MLSTPSVRAMRAAARLQWADQLMENHAYEIDRRWVDRTNVGTTILTQDYGEASRRVQAASRYMTVEEIKAVEDKLKFKEVEAYGSWQQVRSSSRSDIALDRLGIIRVHLGAWQQAHRDAEAKAAEEAARVKAEEEAATAAKAAAGSVAAAAARRTAFSTGTRCWTRRCASTARPRRRERHGPSRTAAARRMAHSQPPLQRMPMPQGYSMAASLRTSRAGRGGAEGVAAAAAATRTKAARLQLVLQLQYAISQALQRLFLSTIVRVMSDLEARWPALQRT